VLCPKCGHEQLETNQECVKCGVIFSKIPAEPKIDSPSISSIDPGQDKQKGWWKPALLVALAFVLIFGLSYGGLAAYTTRQDRIDREAHFQAYKALKKIQASTQGGIVFHDYRQLSNAARLELNLLLVQSKRKMQLEKILAIYDMAGETWDFKIKHAGKNDFDEFRNSTIVFSKISSVDPTISKIYEKVASTEGDVLDLRDRLHGMRPTDVSQIDSYLKLSKKPLEDLEKCERIYCELILKLMDQSLQLLWGTAAKELASYESA